MHPMRLLACSSLVLLTHHGVAHACEWDSDTLAAEAKGIPDVVRIVTGRFERNPPLYYEMRLKRVAAELHTNPGKLEAYDDAGVACDRLKRGDEALAWMARKKLQLDRLDKGSPAWREHTYRYLANTGTMWSHRWMRNGADRKQIGEMKKARDFIAAAIKLNPNAHFGREKVQLVALDWAISPPTKATHPDMGSADEWPMYLPSLVEDPSNKIDLPTMIKGLSGIVVLGGAWENVDIFYALMLSLQGDERAAAAHLARLRTCELIGQGRQSLVPEAPSGEALKAKVMRYENSDPLHQFPAIENTYVLLRQEADEWQAVRTAYMEERLKRGRHPDTDSTFWNDYRDTPAPKIEEPTQSRTWVHYLLALVVLMPAAIVFFRNRRNGP